MLGNFTATRLSTKQADDVRALIDAETEREGHGVEKMMDKLAAVQTKLNKLTRGYLNELIDEES